MGDTNKAATLRSEMPQNFEGRDASVSPSWKAKPCVHLSLGVSGVFQILQEGECPNPSDDVDTVEGEHDVHHPAVEDRQPLRLRHPLTGNKRLRGTLLID